MNAFGDQVTISKADGTLTSDGSKTISVSYQIKLHIPHQLRRA
jgi:hypothetical protein